MKLSFDELEGVVHSYLQVCWPAMLRQRYHLLLAKGGQDYQHLPEQPLLTHILNGIFGLTRLIRFLIEHHVTLPGLDVNFVRQALALYTLHDLGKMPGVEHLDNTEFSIPLERLQQEYETLGLSQFAVLDAHLMRAANVHKRSSRQGDLLQTPNPQAPLLYTVVRIADAMASAITPEEVASSLPGWLVRLGPEFSAGGKGRFSLYWHRIQDVRGVLTNAIHQAVAQRLASELGFYPLLYFTTGLLYIGPRLDSGQTFDPQAFTNTIVDDVLQGLATAVNPREGLRKERYDFQDYVYAYTEIPTLLELIRDDSLIAKVDTNDLIHEDRKTKKRSPGKDFEDGILSKKNLPPGWTSATVFPKLSLKLDESPAFVERWARVYRYLLYANSLAGALLSNTAQPEHQLEWFLKNFPIPESAAANLRQIGLLWAKGGPGKYVIPIAYHFLRGPAFKDRPAEALPNDEVLRRLHEHCSTAFQGENTKARRETIEAKLGFRHDLTNYLNEYLLLSWMPAVKTRDDVLPSYINPKRKSHGNRLCSLCNRSSSYIQPLRTGILDDEGRIFSNRVLPAEKAPQENRSWCPVCHLEFVFRKLVGLGLPSDADYGNSRRLYLYILPTFSFTPEHGSLYSRWLGRFQQITAMPVRDYGADWGIPHRWLLRGEYDPDWLEEVQGVLENQAQRILAEVQKSLKKQAQTTGSLDGHAYLGERLVTGKIHGQPHYYLIVWEKLARGQEQDDSRIATRTEAWTKGVLAAIVISALSGCKVYATERPFLPVVDPAALKATVILDSPPPMLRLLTSDGITLYGRERGTRSGLEQALDLAAALWAANEHLQRHLDFRNQKDKRISERLALANTSRLAGATFYKEYSRLNDGRSPDEVLTRACQVLIELRGGDLMDLVQRLAEKSLEIALPWRVAGRGKPRRYELVFRETVAAMRQAFDAIPDLRRMALTNQSPSEQSVSQSVSELKNLTAGKLLKALERRQQQRRGEISVRAWGTKLCRLAGEFVDLVVDELYLGRAGGSFARLLHLENTVADGIFYYTDQALDEKWDEYNREKAVQQAAEL
jgi:hypothetical protein